MAGDGNSDGKSDGKTDSDDLSRQQPLGGINPKVLIGIAAVLVVAAIVIAIIVFTKT